MEEIYVDYKEMEMIGEQIRDCSANIKSDCTKLTDYIDEIRRVWVGNASNTFSRNMEECVEMFNKVSSMLEDDAETIKLSEKAYEKFELHFMDRKI